MFGVPTFGAPFGRCSPPALWRLSRRKMLAGLAGGVLAAPLRGLPARAQAAAGAEESPAQAPSQSGATQPSPATAPTAGRRVALVVGNSSYRFVSPLPNPQNDAKLMAGTLGELGFELVNGGPVLNVDKAGFDAAVHAFGQQIVGAEIAAFYYAGHGIQVQDKNWLVPVSANPTRAEDLPFEMVDAGVVVGQMEGAGTRLNLVMLDACRNNPFAGTGIRAVGSGLAQMMAPDGTIIAYATQPGAVAADGAGTDSPYTLALSQTIRKPGLDVLRMFNQVALDVKRQTKGAQVPWLSASPIDGDYALAGPAAGTGANAPPAAHQAASAPAPAHFVDPTARFRR